MISSETYNRPLCFHDNSVIADKAEPVEDEVNDEFNESFEEGTEINDSIDIVYKKSAVDFWRSSKTSRRSLSTIQHRYRKVKDLKQLYRWKKQVANNGVRKEKLDISTYVFEQFQRATDHCLPIHDIDLKRWALKVREEVVHKLSTKLFTGSPKWIHNFKKKKV